MTLFFIILSTFLISLISFIGVSVLFLKEKWFNRILLILVAFSAGTLVGAAFFDLLPEALEEVGSENALKVFIFTILGFIVFFILENFIHWHHHHSKDHPEVMPFSYLILISDGLHNFIDGLVIAASFVVSFPMGIITSLAVISHEIPQEIGDFGILVYCGIKRGRALFLNFLSALAAVLGGLIGFFLSEKIGGGIIFLLPFAAGNFLYIACSDLIPEIKQKTAPQKAILHFLVFLLGLALMYVLRLMD